MRGKLRRAAEAAVGGVEESSQGDAEEAEEVARKGLGRAADPNAGRRGDFAGDLGGAALELPALLAPRGLQAFEDREEARPSVPVVGREVRSREERPLVRKEERGKRPAPAPRHELDGRHVDVVDVGPLLAVDLDADPVLVQEARDLLVFERLALHDVAPVAGRIADREKDGPVLAPCLFERLVTPWEPVHRVVRVLAEIGGGFAGEPVHRPSISPRPRSCGPEDHSRGAPSTRRPRAMSKPRRARRQIS